MIGSLSNPQYFSGGGEARNESAFFNLSFTLQVLCVLASLAPVAF